MYIKGLLTFSKGILCKREVLGKSYKREIANIGISISLPSVSNQEYKDVLNRVGISNPLCPPRNGKNIRRGGEFIHWGYPMDYPECNSLVKCVLLECNLDDNQNPQELYDGILCWEASIVNYAKLCTKQYLEKENESRDASDVLALISSQGYVQNTEPQCIFCHFHSSHEFLSEQQFCDAIKFASSGKDFLLEYQMLLSSYESRKNNRNRQAIVDACSAVEVVLINQIQNYCLQKTMRSDIILNKYRSLGDRFDLMEKIDDNFPLINYANSIVRTRNDVVHNRDTNPSDEKTNALIYAVEKIMEHYHETYY